MSGLSYDKFILFGDSITQFSNTQLGFALQPAIQDHYSRKLDVINRGYSGYNSNHARVILPEIIKAELNSTKDNIKLMTIFFGTNDAFEIEDETNKIQAVDVKQYQENINHMVEFALANNIKPIVIGPSIHDCKRVMEFFTDRPTNKAPVTNKRLLDYSNAAKQVALKHKVAFVDLWNSFREYGNWTEQQMFDATGLGEWEVGTFEHLVHDGIHFTPLAYKILYEKLIEAIDLNYPALSSDNLVEKLPYWRDLDPNDYAKILHNHISK
ncbi:Isoamyl acetate-hydrolyzing esterase [Spathaspora sp. JA1]|nr:Isoamyl acetate-hydrolyzing esterase [Spathaspora sp. JA1]